MVGKPQGVAAILGGAGEGQSPAGGMEDAARDGARRKIPAQYPELPGRSYKQGSAGEDPGGGQVYGHREKPPGMQVYRPAGRTARIPGISVGPDAGTG